MYLYRSSGPRNALFSRNQRTYAPWSASESVYSRLRRSPTSMRTFFTSERLDLQTFSRRSFDLAKTWILSCSVATLVGLLSVTFFQTIVPTKLSLPKVSSQILRRFASSLLSIEMKITPSSRKRFLASLSREYIRLNQSEWRRPFASVLATIRLPCSSFWFERLK